MATTRLRATRAAVLALAAHQHGVVARRQLLELGMTAARFGIVSRRGVCSECIAAYTQLAGRT